MLHESTGNVLIDSTWTTEQTKHVQPVPSRTGAAAGASVVVRFHHAASPSWRSTTQHHPCSFTSLPSLPIKRLAQSLLLQANRVHVHQLVSSSIRDATQSLDHLHFIGARFHRVSAALIGKDSVTSFNLCNLNSYGDTIKPETFLISLVISTTQ